MFGFFIAITGNFLRNTAAPFSPSVWSDSMRKYRFQISIGLFVTFVLFLYTAGFINLPFIQRLELWTYDNRLKFTLPEGRDNRIVIVDIDEKSLAEQGRWPWSRNKVAKLVEMVLERYKASIIGFDVVFAEEDHSSGLKVLESLGQHELKENSEYMRALELSRNYLDYDAIMARTLKGKPVILGYYFTSKEGSKESLKSGVLPPPVFKSEQLKNFENDFVRVTGYGANIPQFQQSAMSAGHFNPVTDVDGVVRRVPLLIEYKGDYYQSLSLAMLRGFLGNPDIIPGAPETGSSPYKRLEWLGISDMKIPVDDQATALVPYRGKQGSFPYVSATDVLNGTVNPEIFEGAIVLIGTTAPGLMDLRSTPVMPVYAGVEVHANLIAGMLDNTIKHSPSYAKGAEILTLLTAGIILSFLLPRLGPIQSIALTSGLYGLLTIINFVAWYHQLVIPFASIFMLILIIFVFNESYSFLAESRSKSQIKDLFGQYVPPEIVSVISHDPSTFSMDAECRQMTVLFADVVDFTKISESLKPGDLAQLLNEYLSAMTAIIYEYGGTVDKYMGDAIMAFWGAPLKNPEHARRGIKAALAMQRKMESFREECILRGWPELKIGIGINSGEMRVGNMGSRYRSAYTVMGDAVNLASRLEGLTRHYKTWIIASEETFSLAPDIPVRELDLVRVKGKNRPVVIYQPLDTLAERDNTLLTNYNLYYQALSTYRRKEWLKAEDTFKDFLSVCPDDPVSRCYLNNIAEFRISPPPESWDGVAAFSTK